MFVFCLPLRWPLFFFLTFWRLPVYASIDPFRSLSRPRALAGACYEQNATTISLGNSNSQLRFNQSGSLYLLYEDGAECPSAAAGSRRWSTKIEFVCANNATKDHAATAAGAGTEAGAGAGGADSLEIIEDSNCQLLIQYQTPLACREPIRCKATIYVDHTAEGLGSSGDESIDLTPLISASDNYEARVELPAGMEHLVPKSTKVRSSRSPLISPRNRNGLVICWLLSLRHSTHSDRHHLYQSYSGHSHSYPLFILLQFFLNVCRPLVPKYQLGCAGGSAACMAKVTADGAPEEERVSTTKEYIHTFIYWGVQKCTGEVRIIIG